ncbi:50S ribosomal protein L32, partial [Bienertia sinuspersici]
DTQGILPTPLKRGVGRPSRIRTREEGEQAKEKRAKTIRCTNCGNFGHNIRTCKGGLIKKDKASAEPMVNKSKRSID